MAMAATETTCACRYRTGQLCMDYCGHVVFSHTPLNVLNTWLYCDDCYEGKCKYCKQYRATRDL